MTSVDEADGVSMNMRSLKASEATAMHGEVVTVPMIICAPQSHRVL